MTTTENVTAIGARPIPEFAGVHDLWPRGERLKAIRQAATEYKKRFKQQGEILAVKSVDIAAAPYPTSYAFAGAAIAPHVPLLSMINRMVVVQYLDFSGEKRTLVFEPTDPNGSAEAPFYHHLTDVVGGIPGGMKLAEAYLLKYYNQPDEALRQTGLRPEDVDFITFDHLHVQDLRMLLGSSSPIPGEATPRKPIFGDAKLLAHRNETATFESLHPMQWAWYVEGGLDGVRPESVIGFDGDIELGVGVSLLWTPGHTDGNHSLVINTPDGVWVSSENGISCDNWQPELSKIPGVARYARTYRREVVMNSNTLEDSLDQYDSMVKEKTLADYSRRDPRWLQIQASSELADWRRLWPVRPTFSHDGLSYGRVTGASSRG